MNRGNFIEKIKSGQFIKLGKKFVPTHREHSKYNSTQELPSKWNEKVINILQLLAGLEQGSPLPAGEVKHLIFDGIYPDPKACGKWVGKDDKGTKVAITGLVLSEDVSLFLDGNFYFLQKGHELYKGELSKELAAKFDSITIRTPNKFKGSKVCKDPATGKLEDSYREQGLSVIAGVDEAGRGAWAGPIVGAIVALSPDHGAPEGVMDSKGLDEETREALRAAIESLPHGIGIVTAEEIDEIGIEVANTLIFVRAAEDMKSKFPNVKVDHLLVDGKVIAPTKLILPFPFSCHTQGERHSKAIASASILAKTERDRIMTELAKEFPGYGFEQHKGYGVPAHSKGLNTLGACMIHRKSYAPVAKVIKEKGQFVTSNKEEQTSLFPSLD